MVALHTMRLWTLHPKYLDARGLVAAWREALLAQKILAGATRGYTRHPQLVRFRAHPRPRAAIAGFLAGLAAEAQARGYDFDVTKIPRPRARGQLEETNEQLLHEWRHLLRKLRTRDPSRYRALRDLTMPEAHPLFRIVPGKVQDWEKSRGRNR